MCAVGDSHKTAMSLLRSHPVETPVGILIYIVIRNTVLFIEFCYEELNKQRISKCNSQSNIIVQFAFCILFKSKKAMGVNLFFY